MTLEAVCREDRQNVVLKNDRRVCSPSSRHTDERDARDDRQRHTSADQIVHRAIAAILYLARRSARSYPMVRPVVKFGTGALSPGVPNSQSKPVAPL